MPIKCAAMMVSSMKCIIISPSAASSSLSMVKVRTGQPFLANVSAVARASAAARSPIVLPAKSGSPAILASAPSIFGPRPLPPTLSTVNNLSRGPAMNNCT